MSISTLPPIKQLELGELDQLAFAPGLNFDASGFGTFAVFSEASQVELCFFADAPTNSTEELRFKLTALPNGMHVGRFENLVAGLKYGLRAFGDFAPAEGKFFNPEVLLLDPYAKGISAGTSLSAQNFSHRVDAQLLPLLSAAGKLQPAQSDGVPKLFSVSSTKLEPVIKVASPHPWRQSIIYELHVKGFSIGNPLVPQELRGTYAGLAHPASIAYLQDLGVTAVELLPIQAIMNEPHLERLGLQNYWGYNTVAFFAPNPNYATQKAQEAGPDAVLQELRQMVASLQAAGIEVILDVVYNHSAEGDLYGPTFNFKGLGAGAYYFWQNTDAGRQLVNTTGTGNTLNADSPWVQQLVLDSLRFWASEIGADGFRFDLAPTLGRTFYNSQSGSHSDSYTANTGDPAFTGQHPLLRSILQDPVLRNKKLIAEPWDIGFAGWQSGNFGTPWRQWNDSFRDTVRRFWLQNNADQFSAEILRELAGKITGSALTFANQQNFEQLSLNFVTAHDGFSLHDLTAYNHKHNELNGEENRDGNNSNFSFNHGVEGSVEADSPVAAARDLTARNLLATLLLSSGTPMLNAGDEVLRSAAGNNNAYCQDNELNHLAWQQLENNASNAPFFQVDSKRAQQQLAFTRALIKARQALPQLNPARFFEPLGELAQLRPQPAVTPVLGWLNTDSTLMQEADWFDPERRHLIYVVPGLDNLALVAISQEDAELELQLAAILPPDCRIEILIDTTLGQATYVSANQCLSIPPHSVVAVKIASSAGIP